MIEVMAAGLPVTAAINWATWAALRRLAAPGEPRSLQDRRWVALGIALLSTSLTGLGIAYLVGRPIAPEIFAALLVAPVYALTAVNLVWLWLTYTGRW
jgi:hypothetical protein